MLGLILTILILGAIAGFIARAIVPGKDSMGIIPTIVLGIVGGALFLGLHAIKREEAGEGDDLARRAALKWRLATKEA